MFVLITVDISLIKDVGLFTQNDKMFIINQYKQNQNIATP